MSARAYALGGALLLAAAAPAAAPAAAQGTVSVAGPAGDPIRDAAPAFEVRTADFPPGDRPTAVTLQISSRVDFVPPLVYEATVAGEGGTLLLERPLPERQTVYWRARARTAAGREVLSPVVGPRGTPSWLTLVAPAPAGGTVGQRRPTFVWRTAPVTTPPGPWRYELSVTNVGTGQTVLAQLLADTAFTPLADLDASTSYRWGVVARLPGGDSSRVASRGTFVVVADDGLPGATLLYQNFPNPFPARPAPGGVSAGRPGGGGTCVWFDLGRPSPVRLEVYSLRGDRVRTLAPAPGLSGVLPRGRYGRGAAGSVGGCDARLSWDGTAEDGRVVPAGVYLLRLEADGSAQVRKIVFRGR